MSETSVKTPTTKEELDGFVATQQLEAEKDANKAPDASPWRLVQIAGIKKLLKAFLVARELHIREIYDEQLTKDTNRYLTIDEKNELQRVIIKNVDSIIDEEMK
ncbi:MAG: hypothetical protein V3U54_08465 [Thermodesulfobacteriota bacterium]